MKSTQGLFSMNPSRSITFWGLLLVFILVFAGLACTVSLPIQLTTPQPQETAGPSPTPGPTPLPSSEINFSVEIPANSPADQLVYLVIVDEVTGLALNSQRIEMKADEQRHFSYTMRFTVGTLIKYRYSRKVDSIFVEEHISDGRQLRYRMLHVEGPGDVRDVVTRWTDTTTDVVTGRISGHALDSFSGQPIPNLLVNAAGSQTLTASDGSYLLEGLPPGTHNLVAASLDGTYLTFQQGALVAADSTTPAELRLTPASLVNITFKLGVPEGTIPAIPIRMAGSLYQLGNTFSDLSGGINTIASRMPVLSLQPDGSYLITLALPAGADLRYLYSLGDGFWNTELDSAGKHRVRQLIVPEKDSVIEDTVDLWTSGEHTPITFDLTVPTNTLPGDTISIQFNPLFGWTEPIPMWQLSANRWAYVLNGPLHTIESMHYRYCRNDQCSSADDGQTPGPDNSGYPVQAGKERSTLKDVMQNWAWFDPADPPAVIDPVEIKPRGVDFSAGIEFTPYYHPSWLPLTGKSMDAVRGLNANWVYLSPTWTYTRKDLPILEQVTGQDALWLDLQQTIQAARAGGLNVAVMPTPRFPTTADQWWHDSKRDFPWWVVWFERYRTFALHHADLAAQSDSQAIVLGGDWIGPALPGGLLTSGSSSGVPADAEARWRTFLNEVRQRYTGKIIWALTYEQAVNNPPAFLDEVDQIYVLFSPPLSTQPDPVRSDLQAEAAKLLDTGLMPFQVRFSKPVILGIAYASADGASTGCLPGPQEGVCLNVDALVRPNNDVPMVLADLGEQADLYSAVLAAVNERTWISGIVSRGYYPPADLQDKSISMHGKPAQEILKTWFAGLLVGLP
jgi:hypothetical protein